MGLLTNAKRDGFYEDFKIDKQQVWRELSNQAHARTLKDLRNMEEVLEESRELYVTTQGLRGQVLHDWLRVCSDNSEGGMWSEYFNAQDQAQESGGDGNQPGNDSAHATLNTDAEADDGEIEFDTFEEGFCEWWNSADGRFRRNYDSYPEERNDRFAEYYAGDVEYFKEPGSIVLLHQAEDHPTVICWEDYSQYWGKKNNKKRAKKTPIPNDSIVQVMGPVRTHDYKGQLMHGDPAHLEAGTVQTAQALWAHRQRA